MKKYIIVDREEKHDVINVVSEDTKDLKEIFYSHIPLEIREDSLESFKPKIFENRSEAVTYKNVIQAQSNYDWKNNGHIHRIYGKNKKVFKIEEYNEELFNSIFTIVEPS